MSLKTKYSMLCAHLLCGIKMAHILIVAQVEEREFYNLKRGGGTEGGE